MKKKNIIKLTVALLVVGALVGGGFEIMATSGHIDPDVGTVLLLK